MRKEYRLEIKPNKSVTYMYPFVNEQLGLEFPIENTYISFSKDEPEFCILVDWSSDPNFIVQEERLFKHHLFLGHADLGGYTVYKIKMTQRMKEGLEMFKRGEYTLFTDKHKNSIIDFLTKVGATNIHRIKQILDPDGSLVSSPPDIEKETLWNHVKEINFKPDNFKD